MIGGVRLKLDEDTMKKRIMAYILSVKSPVVTLPWLREVILSDVADEVDIDEFEKVLTDLLGSELEWVDEDKLTVRLRTQSWKQTEEDWK